MSRTAQQGRGLSVRQMTFIFFGGVGVCAVFFALGFVAGTNRRPPAASPAVEEVPPPSTIPPTVNPPLQDVGSGSPGSSLKSHTSTIIEQNLKPSSEAPAAVGTHASPAAAQAESIALQNSPARNASTSPVTAHTARSFQRGIMVQVAALRTEQDAQSLLHVLKSHGYPAVVVTPEEAHAADNLYRVQVGPFESRADALKTLHKLGSQGFRPFIKE